MATSSSPTPDDILTISTGPSTNPVPARPGRAAAPETSHRAPPSSHAMARDLAALPAPRTILPLESSPSSSSSSASAAPAPPLPPLATLNTSVEELRNALGALYMATSGRSAETPANAPGASSSIAATSAAAAAAGREDGAAAGDALDAVARRCVDGGDVVVGRQRRIGAVVVEVQKRTREVAAIVDERLKEVRAAKDELKRTDRLSLAVADLHDSLEECLLQASVVGRRFYNADEDLYSFQNYLRRHPPDVTSRRSAR